MTVLPCCQLNDKNLAVTFDFEYVDDTYSCLVPEDDTEVNVREDNNSAPGG